MFSFAEHENFYILGGGVGGGGGYLYENGRLFLPCTNACMTVWGFFPCSNVSMEIEPSYSAIETPLRMISKFFFLQR